MNKILKAYQEEKNLQEWNGKYVYGTIDDYPVSIMLDNFSNPASSVAIFGHFTPEQKLDLQVTMEKKKKDWKIVLYEVHDHAVIFSVRAVTLKSAMENIRKVLDELLLHFKELQIEDAVHCPICGNEMENRCLTLVYNHPVFMDQTCIEQIHKEMEEEEKKFQGLPNNYGKGVLGAFAGGIIGAILWVLIGAFAGFISAWIAAAIALLAGVGYDKMGGKKTTMKIVICSLVTLFYVVIATFVMYLVVLRMEFPQYDAFSLLMENLTKNAEFTGLVIRDLIVGLIFGGIGVGIAASSMLNKVHRKK